jgi:hypothetical protein
MAVTLATTATRRRSTRHSFLPETVPADDDTPRQA